MLRELAGKASPAFLNAARMGIQIGPWPLSVAGLAAWDARVAPPQFLIVTVHDPVDSHLQTYFDADFAVIQRAIQRHHLIVSQHWLPWQQWVQQAANSNEKREEPDRSYEANPGILLCHSSSTWFPNVLVVLLVGETPTEGVHAKAFESALEIASQYNQTIRIVGPSASGSCFSIQQGLTEWYRKNHQRFNGQVDVRLISGSATSKKALDQLNFNASYKNSSLNSKVQTTILPDSVATDLLLDYLVNERNIRPSQIAILEESDTSYAQSAINAPPHGRKSKTLRFEDLLLLPFPMELGTVRNEYEKSHVLKFGPQEPTTTPRINLEVPWGEPPYARDHLPQFSDATPAVTERRMSMMLSAIAQRDIRAVGVLGTDPKDLLYLGKQIARYCPNVQLFTFESNVLLTHPDYVGLFKGTIVASTYPAFMNNQEWSRITPSHFAAQFSSTLSEGVFNATLAQLEQMKNDLRKASGHTAHVIADPGSPTLVEYSSPFSPKTYGSPPLWLTVVGQNGLLPVKVIPPDIKNDERDLLYQPLSRPPGERPAPMNLGLPPFTLLTIVINTCILAITIAFLLENLNAHPTNIFKKRYSPEMFAWLHLTTAKSRPRSSGSATWSCVYALILFISLTAFQLIVNTLNRRLPKLPHGMYDLYWPQVVARVIAFVTLAACLLAILCILSRAFQGEKPNNRVLSYFLTILLTLTSLVASAILTFAPWFGGSQLLTAIQFERWGSVVEGVTPLVPLACMAFIPVVWAACQLRRGYFDRIHGLVQPYSEQETPGLAKRLQDLDAAVTKPYWIPVEFRDWILLACIVWFGGSLYFRWIRTADAPYFDAFFWTFGLIDVALIYTLHVRFMAASGLLERLLRRIAQTQLADSFKQVPPRLKSKAAGQIFAASPHPGDLNIVTRQLEDLVHRIPFKDVKLQRQSRIALRRFKKMDTCARLNKAFVNACLYPINDSLSKSCRRIIKHVVHRHYAAENAQAPDLSDNNWNIDAANFIATQTTTLIRQAFAQIQNLLIFLTIMLLLLICAVYSYPFQPRHYISFCLIGLVMWTIVSIVVTFIRLNRNEVLSNLSDTTPNHFTPDRALVRQLFVFGLIPLLSLLAFQFPEFGNVFFFWVNGMQNAFK